MSEQETKSIALFFFLAFLDDKKGVELSQKVAKRLKRIWSADASVDHALSLVSECFNTWTQALASKGQIIGSLVASEETLKLPQNVGLEAWKKFLQLEHRDNVFPLIWTEVLGYSEEVVGQATKISQCTIRTRIARGLAHLGSHCSLEKAHA